MGQDLISCDLEKVEMKTYLGPECLVISEWNMWKCGALWVTCLDFRTDLDPKNQDGLPEMYVLVAIV